MTASDLEFVGVHVRRTDFLPMYADIYPNAQPPEHTFYLNAIQWMRDHLKPRPLLFIITSDDLEWCHQYLNTSLDIVIAGKFLFVNISSHIKYYNDYFYIFNVMALFLVIENILYKT
jgi:hypothetical protein